MARCYWGCVTLNNRIAHVLLLLAFLAGCALAGWGIAIIQPCHAQLMTCQQQLGDPAAKRAVCTPQFSSCSDAGWRRVIGALLLFVACALGSSYFCCCSQRPPEALGCCCNCCHAGKAQRQRPMQQPGKMVHRPPVASMPPRLAYGPPPGSYPPGAYPPGAYPPGAYPPGAYPPSMQRVALAGPPPRPGHMYSYPPRPTAPPSFTGPPPPPPAAAAGRPGMQQQQQGYAQQQMGLGAAPAGYPPAASADSYANVQPVMAPQPAPAPARPVTGAQPVPLHAAVNVPVAIQ